MFELGVTAGLVGQQPVAGDGVELRTAGVILEHGAARGTAGSVPVLGDKAKVALPVSDGNGLQAAAGEPVQPLPLTEPPLGSYTWTSSQVDVSNRQKTSRTVACTVRTPGLE